MIDNPNLNSIKETIALGGTEGAINKPNDTSQYFIFISIVSSKDSSYNSIQLYYDLLYGHFYTRAVRDGFTVFDSWYKHEGTRVV